MISSQLQSQLFPKKLTWAILLERYPRDFWRQTPPPEMRVEVWAQTVYVHLPKSPDRRGVSIFLSYWDYIDYFMQRSQTKAQLVNVMQMRSNIFTATSSQGSEGELHTVHFTLWGASCSCMLYKCLRNRIAGEVPYYWQLMKKSRYFSGQVICHHIEAALNYQGFTTLEDYIQSKKRKHKPLSDEEMDELIDRL
jgi:hypothetical protein